MKQVIIIDYGSGNLHSIAKAFEHAATGRNFKVILSNKASDIKKASHIVLPGVGAFGDCLAGLSAAKGVIDELHESVLENKKPFLGVCVGMQMLADEGLEHGTHKGLGWIKGKVIPIKTSDTSLKIPHMGWNNLEILQTHPIFKGIKSGDHAYFVHSYYFDCHDKDNILSIVEYGGRLTASIAKDNIIATQFHPEKSQETGLRLIGNFLGI